MVFIYHIGTNRKNIRVQKEISYLFSLLKNTEISQFKQFFITNFSYAVYRFFINMIWRKLICIFYDTQGDCNRTGRDAAGERAIDLTIDQMNCQVVRSSVYPLQGHLLLSLLFCLQMNRQGHLILQADRRY